MAIALTVGAPAAFADVGDQDQPSARLESDRPDTVGQEAGEPDADEPDAVAKEAVARDTGTEQASLSQEFSAPDEPHVGDRLGLTLEVTHPSDASVYLPDSFGNPRWELTETQRNTVDDEAREITTLELTFQIFRPGSTTLPGFDVTVVEPLARDIKLQTDPVEAKVISTLPPDETPPLEGHRHPVAVWTDDYTLAWVGGILGGALLAALLTLLVVRSRRDEDQGPPPRPAHIVAMEKLSALTTGELLDQNEYMVFYVRMSEAVREYLGRRYGFRGTELTTTEILDKLEQVEWPAGLSHDDIRGWLEHCDLIKFSGVIPKRERAEQALRRGFSIVELTRPKPEPEPETGDREPDTDEPDTDEPGTGDRQPEPEPDPESGDREPDTDEPDTDEPGTGSRQPEPEPETGDREPATQGGEQ